MVVYGSEMDQKRGRSVLYETTRVALRTMTDKDQQEFIELAKASAELHEPWVWVPTTSQEYVRYLRRFDESEAESTLICIRGSGAIAGFVTIKNIIRGPYQRATVGYGAFAPTQGLGFMSEGFGLVFRFAFGDLGLHRLEADIQPGNTASRRFAERVGFRYEGFSPGFLRIDGSWKDYERWAVTSDMIEHDRRALPADVSGNHQAATTPYPNTVSYLATATAGHRASVRRVPDLCQRAVFG